jgi:hypothetical protein
MENEPPVVGVGELEAKRQRIADQALEKKSKQVVTDVKYDLTRIKAKRNNLEK